MLTLSTIIPVVGSIGVAIHWLMDARSVRKKTRLYHRVDKQIRTEAAAKFRKDDHSSSDWIEKELAKRLREGGIKDTDGIPVADFDAAMRIGSLPISKAAEADQWVLIITAITGVILMGLGL
jgi:hypothetical protein